MLPASTPCHTGAMAKRWRDEAAPSKRSGLLRRRKGATGGVDTLEPEDDAPKRRRIAGERPSLKADDASDEPGTLSTPATQEEAERPDGKSESREMAQALAEKSPNRRRFPQALWAAATGLVVGALLTGLVYAGMQAFQAIYNTPAGNGVGAGVLVAVLVIAMLAGRFLLKWRNLHDPSATTLLAVLLMVIVTLGVLLPIVFSTWMLLITPLLGAATYLLSHLLVTHFGQAPNSA